MVNILFVCLGNICRSPMAEFVMKKLVKDKGLESHFTIASAATSYEESGNPVYPPARAKLAEHGISCKDKYAVRVSPDDYDKYDYIVVMDRSNLRNITRIVGEDRDDKIRLLMSYTGANSDVADPWYTGDFEATWQDVWAGCNALLEKILSEKF